VLLEDANRDNSVGDVVTRLLSTLNAPVRILDHTIPVTASVGTAMSDGSHDATELLRNADLAMYRAKTQGRHRAATYDVPMHSEALARLHLEGELREAMEADQFEVH
jgi:GGDEF domain-containing protein